MRHSIVVFLSLLLVLTSCEDDKKEDEVAYGTLKLSVELYNGSDRVFIDDTISLTDEYDLYLSLFRLYLSEISVMSESGKVALSSIKLLDPASTVANSFNTRLETGSYSDLSFGVGVDSVQNDLLPGSFPNEHPLSSYQSMYWSMLKYRFAKFEGKAKSRTTGQDNIFIAYHPGTDDLYQQRSFPSQSFSINEDQVSNLVLKIDVNEILNGPAGRIDMATEPQSHSTPTDIDISRRFMENLTASLSLEELN